MVAPDHVSRRALVTVGLVAAAVLLAGYYLLGPESGVYPRCLFRQVTGLECPGCGSQRAIHALLHGRVAEAWSYNALLLVEIPLIGLLLAAQPLRSRYPRLHRVLNSLTVILIVLATIIAWTIFRNL